MKQTLLLTILLVLHIAALPAQEDYIIHTRHYGAEEGLSHRRVTGILQDNQGFIWASTQSGLNRFDGYHFKYWTQAEGLTSDHIITIEEDAEGYIWAFSENSDHTTASIDLVDSRSGEVLPFSKKFPGKLPFSEKNLIARCLRDDTGEAGQDKTLYFGTVNPGGIAAYHPKTGFRFTTLQGVRRFNPFLLTAQKTIWGVADEVNLAEADLNGNILRRYDHGIIDEYGTITFAGAAGDDDLLVSFSPENIGRFMSTIYWDGTLRQIAFADSFKTTVKTGFPQFLQRLPSLPLTMRNGKVIEDGSGREFYDLLKDFPETKIGLEGDCFIDRSGTVWIGGSFGLYCIEIQPNHFRQFLHTPTHPLTQTVWPFPPGGCWKKTERFG